MEKNQSSFIVIPFKPMPVKNMKMPLKRKDGGVSLIDKPEAREYKKKLDEYLLENYSNIRFEGKVSIGYHFYISTNGRIDCSNMLQGIEDALQRVGIIEDDTWQKCSIAYAEGFPVASKKDERSEIMIFNNN